MPAIDMSLEKLLEYQGVNPCPEDMDLFWDKGIKEMKSLAPCVELIPADFQVPCAECYDLYFTGVKGARIHAKYIRPKKIKKPHPAVLWMQGYGDSSGQWTDKLSYIAMGYSIAAIDCRGQYGISQDVGGIKGMTLKGHITRGLDDLPEYLLYRQVFLDTAQLAGIVMDMPEVDENRVGVFGGSQGGGLSLACAALEPRIKLAAVVFPFLCDYKRVWQLDFCQGAYYDIVDYFRWYDPKHEREDAIFTKLGYIDVQHLAKRIRAEVLMQIGLMDNVCPPSTQFAAFNKITSPKNFIVYPDFGHEWAHVFVDENYRFLTKLD